MPSSREFTFEGLTARLEQVRLPIGLALERIELECGPAAATTRPPGLTLAAPARFSATVSAGAIAEFLESRSPGGLRDVRLELSEGEVRVRATVKLLIELQVSAVCRLTVAEGRRLDVELVSAEVANVGAANLLRAQLEKLNPIFETSDLPFPATLESAEVGEGEVVVRGTALPPVEGGAAG